MQRYVLVICGLIACMHSMGQSNAGKDKKKSNDQTTSAQPSSLEPYYPAKVYEPKKKKSSGKVTYDAVDDFYKRQEQLVKLERKNEKAMDKPQYSDPMYFGHKRPPKKRPPEKMKYCKVCGIRH